MGRIHIYPLVIQNGLCMTSHCTDHTGMCWCKPEEKQVCSESNDFGQCPPECWRCAGSGLVDPYDGELNVLIVHKQGQRPPDELDRMARKMARR